MITCSAVIAEVIKRLEDNISEFPEQTEITETSEDDFTGTINPPYLGVYVDFDTDCEILPMGIPKDVPISLYIICHSAGEKTASKSFDIALQMAMKALKIAVCEYENIPGLNSYFFIEAQNKPFLVLQKSTEGSVVLTQMQYKITLGDV